MNNSSAHGPRPVGVVIEEDRAMIRQVYPSCGASHDDGRAKRPAFAGRASVSLLQPRPTMSGRREGRNRKRRNMTVNKRDAAPGQERESDDCQSGSEDLQSNARDNVDGESTRIPPPLEARRLYCLGCCNGSALEVRLCSEMSCPLWPYRLGRNPTADMIAQLGDRPLHPLEDAVTAAEFHKKGGTGLKAIKRRCLDCSGYSKSEVRDCSNRDCPLHPFREGRNPNRKMRPEQSAIRAELLKANLARKKNRDVG